MTDLLTSNERLRQLLIEARPYIESFALLSKHPTAPDDARNLAWKINEAIRATREASTSEPPQPGAKEQIKRYDFELIDARTYMERAAMVETSEGRWVRWSEVQSILPTHETTELNSCRARLHDISNGPLYDLQMSARREVGLAIDEARTALARACHDLRRATTVAESSVETAARPVDKTTERLCIRPNGRHSMALDVDGKPYCTWCDWPVNDVVPAVDPSPLQSDADHLMQALVKQEGVLNACEALLREAINDEGVNAGFDERLAAYWKRSAALASSPEEPGICIHSLKGHAGDKCPECGDGPCPHVNGIARA